MPEVNSDGANHGQSTQIDSRNLALRFIPAALRGGLHVHFRDICLIDLMARETGVRWRFKESRYRRLVGGR